MRKVQWVMVAMAVAGICASASALNPNWGDVGTSYINTTGGTVYVLNAPTSWANIGASPTVLSGAGPDGGDAWYKPGNTGSGDDSTKAYWNFEGAPLIPNVGTDLASGLYAYQVYVSDYGALSHENDGVFGTPNGAWGYHALGDFSSWNGVSQGSPGWVSPNDWGTGTGGMAWLSNTGFSDGLYTDMSIIVKWNPWGGYGGLAVSGVRVSTDGNFEVPEPASALLLLLGVPFLRRRR